MDLWQGTLRDFVGVARSGAIAADMTGRFVAYHGTTPNPAEVRSWQNSLAVLADALRSVRGRDVGVSVAAAGGASATGPAAGTSRAAEREMPGVGVVAEYHIPLSGSRVDVMLCGMDASRRPGAVVLELKQWSAVSLEDAHAVNVTVDGVEHVHPSQQALDYAEWLSDYHSAFADGAATTSPVAFCHNLERSEAVPLLDPRFAGLLERSALFLRGDEAGIAGCVSDRVGWGGGVDVLRRVVGGVPRPSRNVLETLKRVLDHEEAWHLLDAQRLAHGAILAEVKRQMERSGGRSVVLVRGGPGTGKTVIAVQLLADALRLGWSAAHSTGGKAFTTALRSKFKGADRLFVWNMNLRNAPEQGVDLLLVDEAHRVRRTSANRFQRSSGKPQVRELIDAARVTVFFLDENQSMRPDEIGSTALVQAAARDARARLRTYDLVEQFRCAGCEEYVAWVDRLLGFRDGPAGSWGERYAFRLAERPEELQALVSDAAKRRERARLVAGFCWRWSEQNADGSLVPDVRIGGWAMPWNRKPLDERAYRPADHPYTRWAETDEGTSQVGCIYSAQGFEFQRVGVIWGPDLVWRDGAWRADPSSSHDRMVSRSGPEMERLVRNAYRVLLTRGAKETVLLCLDRETREHVASVLAEAGA